MGWTLGAASWFYFLLSTSELAFSVKYHLHHKMASKDTGLARDAIFGVFLVLFLICFSFNITPKKTEERNTAVAGPHAKLLRRMQQESRGYILQRLDAVAREDEVAPPSFHTLVAELQGDRDRALSDQTREDLGSLSDDEKLQIRRLYDQFLIRLDREYGHMRVDNVPREF